MGLTGSKAFAGGSCKQIFCHEFESCQLLSDSGECRNPDQARPSMSGFGINVSELMRFCGWPADIKTTQTEAVQNPLSWVASLVLIG